MCLALFILFVSLNAPIFANGSSCISNTDQAKAFTCIERSMIGDKIVSLIASDISSRRDLASNTFNRSPRSGISPKNSPKNIPKDGAGAYATSWGTGIFKMEEQLFLPWK
jgi:hypothetical protein